MFLMYTLHVSIQMINSSKQSVADITLERFVPRVTPKRPTSKKIKKMLNQILIKIVCTLYEIKRRGGGGSPKIVY